MSRIVAAIFIALSAGIAIGAWVLGDASSTDEASHTNSVAAVTESSTPIEERLRRLEQIIADERDARIALEDQLKALVDEIERADSSGLRTADDQTALAE